MADKKEVFDNANTLLQEEKDRIAETDKHINDITKKRNKVELSEEDRRGYLFLLHGLQLLHCPTPNPPLPIEIDRQTAQGLRVGSQENCPQNHATQYRTCRCREGGQDVA